MDKERLEEIKDSANLQLALAKKLNFDKNTIELISEEIELLDYINDLQNRIDEAIEYIENISKEEVGVVAKTILLNILKGGNK